MVSEIVYVTGIDMSSAFDTIRRTTLLDILQTFLEEDEVRIIQYLLSNTILEIKMSNVTTDTFESNIGAPQGDALSGTLFTIYFEYALRKIRSELNKHKILDEHSYCKQRENLLTDEIIYADDADFLTDNKDKNNRINRIVKDFLLEDNLKINEDKTEHTVLVRKNVERNNNKKSVVERRKEKEEAEPWRSVVKLGSKLGDSEDIIYRKELSNTAMNRINTIWIKKDKIKEDLRIKMYKSIIKPVMLYNSSTWGITKEEEKNLNSFHRKQLRRILNVKYPIIMKNKEIYSKTGEKPISLEIVANRWRMFGHALRMSTKSPAYKAMYNYFTITDSTKFRGRRRETLPQTLHNDIQRATSSDDNFYNKFKVNSLRKLSDLEQLKVLAMNRNEWKKISKVIYKTAEAETNNSEMN